MKARLIFLLLFIVLKPALAQVLQPAKLTASASRSDVKAGDEIELIFTASIDKGWYIYSLGFDPECGPIPISIALEKNNTFEIAGELRAINDKKKHDEIFDCDVRIFEGKGEFRQKVRILSSNPSIKGTYEGQVCTEKEGKCVLFDGDISIGGIKVIGATTVDPVPAFPTDSSSQPVGQTEKDATGGYSGPVLDESILEGESSLNNESFLGYLFFAFILGLTSLITPCVFPMIPMTVTFFLRDNQTRRAGVRKAIIFGFSIILIYTLAGSVFALALGADGLNALATHWAPNLFVFAIFIVFALSFFGLFEINAPYQLVNKADQQAEKGGLLGIFFMAATLVLVSFSCTIPIVGNVIVMAAGGQILKPVMAMFFYALAFAIPFTLFAIFPEWIKSMPKSGGWLNSVKVTLGFLELALALKFFSIADQAYHWGLLDRDVNIALWVVIFTLMGFYLLGKLPMKGDTPVESLSVPRLLFATLTFSFVVYIAPGLWGAPLKALAGYLPPMYTLDFNVTQASNETGADVCEEPLYAEFLHLPHGLQGYFDYQQALNCAREQNKPLFIDFTGHGCTNCREMEAVVWSDPQVLSRLRSDFVVVALYVDDKTVLQESQWYTSTHDKKVKKTIGKQNADLQIRTLDNNAQPFYVLLGKDERVLAWPYGYDRSPENFVRFLERGKSKYRELYNSGLSFTQEKQPINF
jgi:thiol:disulfide interchange protein